MGRRPGFTHSPETRERIGNAVRKYPKVEKVKHGKPGRPQNTPEQNEAYKVRSRENRRIRDKAVWYGGAS